MPPSNRFIRLIFGVESIGPKSCWAAILYMYDVRIGVGPLRFLRSSHSSKRRRFYQTHDRRTGPPWYRRPIPRRKRCQNRLWRRTSSRSQSHEETQSFRTSLSVIKCLIIAGIPCDSHLHRPPTLNYTRPGYVHLSDR